MALRNLPRNGTDHTRVLLSLDGEVQNLAPPSLSEIPVEQAEPIREFFAWSHKRNYEGYWFSTTTRDHIRFESLLERQFLMSADHDPDIVAISAQPLALLWPTKTVSESGKSLRSHVPDFFCRTADGNGLVIDGRRPDKTDDPHFHLTGQLCDQVGWRYIVFAGLESPTAESLEWLSGYRLARYAPATADRESILNAFHMESSLQSGVLTAARTTGKGRDVILGNALHLLFHDDLQVEYTQPLTMESIVARGPEPRMVDTGF